MSNGTITVEAKKYAMRQSKDGVILSLVIHPNDATSELLSAPIGQQWVVALAPYIETSSRSVPIYNDEGKTGLNVPERDLHSPSPDSPVSEGIAPVVDQTEKGSGGSNGPTAGADRAIKMAHVYAGGDTEILTEIRDYCDVKSCAEFKTNPKALARFHDWEFINGYVQVRP